MTDITIRRVHGITLPEPRPGDTRKAWMSVGVTFGGGLFLEIGGKDNTLRTTLSEQDARNLIDALSRALNDSAGNEPQTKLFLQY